MIEIAISIPIVYFIKTTKVTQPQIGWHKKIRIILGLNILFLIVISLLMNVINNVINTFDEGQNVLMIMVIALSAGISEELLCRGLLFSIFNNIFKENDHAFLYSALLSSFIFGILHLSNSFINHQAINITLQQIFVTFVIGLIFSVFRVATNGLLFGIIIHTIIDIQPTVAQVSSNNSSWIGLLIVFIPGIILSTLYLYKVDKIVNHDKTLA